jgi:hypothetical protein
MVKQDSVLRRLPAELDPVQRLYIDGIRHCAEIAELAYPRLQRTLTEIAKQPPNGSATTARIASAFLDAWALVDVIDRFRLLWASLPGIPVKPNQTTRTFAEIAENVRALRNVADHLSQRIPYVIAHKGTALGVLSWFTMLDQQKGEGVICTLVPGTMANQHSNVVNPGSKEIELPTGLIQLAAGEHKACLSEILPEMARRIAILESSLEQAFASANLQKSHSGADLLVRMYVTFGLDAEDGIKSTCSDNSQPIS